MKKRLTLLAGVAWLGLSGGVVQAAQHPIVHVSLLSAPFGGAAYVLGTALQDISNKSKSWVRVDASESPGYVYNIKELASSARARRTTVVGSGKGLLGLAEAGDRPFHKKYPPLKLICNFNLVGTWLATLNPHITSVADLVGKRVGLGNTAVQVNWGIEPKRIIRVGWRLGPSKVVLSSLSIKGAVAALLDGHVSAAIVGGYLNPYTHELALSPQTLQFMAAGRNYRFIPWGTGPVKKAIASGLNILSVDLPPNTIKGVAYRMPIFADTNGWFVSSQFPNDVAYELTKLIIQNVNKFAQYSALGKLMSAKALVYGFPEKEIDPGALRAYRQAGILK